MTDLPNAPTGWIRLTVQGNYAPPLHQFARGRMGATRQPRPGRLGFAVMMAVTLLVIAGAIALAVA